MPQKCYVLLSACCQGAVMSLYLRTDDVNPDLLDKVVSVRFYTVKLLFSICNLWKYLRGNTLRLYKYPVCP